MADTGAPHFIPYIEPSDLVRDYPAADEAQAEAVADALDAAGGLVAVKSAIKSDVQASSAVATGTAVPITGLSIAHAVADASNTVYLFAMLHLRAGTSGNIDVGARLKAGATLLGVGNASGSRTRVTAFVGGGRNASGPPNGFSNMQANMTAIASHAPGSTASVTYSVDAVQHLSGTQVVFINRSSSNTNDATNALPTSTLFLVEVKV